MALTLVDLGTAYFPDPTKGRPLFNSSIYVGEPDTDPEILGNQKQITLRQEDGTEVPVSQPVMTGAGGVILYNGSPAQILVDGNYSITVLNSLGAQSYHVDNMFNGVPITTGSLDQITDLPELLTAPKLEIGADQVNYDAANNFIDGVVRTQEQKNGDAVNVMDFGAVGDGITDDAEAWQAAADHIDSVGGGTVIIPSNLFWFLGAQISLGENVGIYREGMAPLRRDMGTTKFASPGTVYCDSASPAFNMKSGCFIEGLTLINEALSYPVTSEVDFSKTAIFVDGFSGGDPAAHEVTVRNINVMGFERAVDASPDNTERVKCLDINFDCRHGVRYETVMDRSVIERCHGWPWLTIANGVTADGDHYRSGIGFAMQGSVDWIQLVDNFCFHYQTGYLLNDSTTSTLIGCQNDNASSDLVNTSNIGFRVTGTSSRVKFIGCSCVANGRAWLFESTDNVLISQPVMMVGCATFGNPDQFAVVVDSGNVIINACSFSDVPNVIRRQNNAGYVSVNECSFSSVSGTVYSNNSTVTDGHGWMIGSNNFYENVTAINATGAETPWYPTIASASTVVLNMYSALMSVTGTTTINSFDLTTVPMGSIFTLYFSGAITVNSSGNISLAGNLAQAFTTGDTLTLAHTGLGVTEVARSINT